MHGNRRIEHKLSTSQPLFLIDDKVCNRLVNGLSLFPSTPSDEGRRRASLLANATVQEGGDVA
jgi:DNA-binding sugar fermentation-stimulating protein